MRPAGAEGPQVNGPAWQDEDALDALIDKLEACQLSHKQALMQARKLEAPTSYNFEIQNFISNRLWALADSMSVVKLDRHQIRAFLA